MNKEKLLEMLECAKINCKNIGSNGLAWLPIVEAQINECMNIVNRDDDEPNVPNKPPPPPPILYLQEGIDMVRHPKFVNDQIKEDIEFLKSKYGKEKSLKIPTTIMRVVGFAEKCLEDCR
jgi:hypothetical protein